MNFRFAGSDLFAPDPGDFRARGFTTRPGWESEPEMDWRESLRGLGLMMRSEGLPRNEAAVMLMFASVAIMGKNAGILVSGVGVSVGAFWGEGRS